MKTEILEYITPLELRRVMAKLVGRAGSQVAAARQVGVTPSFFNNILSGRANAKRKLLSYFGLEQRTVYVRKTSEQKKAVDIATEMRAGET